MLDTVQSPIEPSLVSSSIIMSQTVIDSSSQVAYRTEARVKPRTVSLGELSGLQMRSPLAVWTNDQMLSAQEINYDPNPLKAQRIEEKDDHNDSQLQL
jgi:hypothetical protein